MKSTWTALSLAAALGACGGTPTAALPGADLGTQRQAARDHQGTQLQGGTEETAYALLPVPGSPAASDPLAPDGRPFDVVGVRYGSLLGKRAETVWEGPALAGSVFHGVNARTGSALTFSIVQALPRATSFSGLPEYELEVKVRDDATGAVGPLCDGPGLNRAVATPGTWDVYGQALPDSSRFTLACLTGVVEKCNRWGYHSWDPTYARYHQACTRMARADYCGNGTPHTVNGTLVDLYDRRGASGEPGFLAPDPSGPTLAFEAGWAFKGPAVCLSKLRWATLPLGGFCPLVLPDPRVVDVKKDPRAQYCEDLGKPSSGVPFLIALEALGALVFNDSAYVDSGLYTWSQSASGERFTTTTGAYAPARGTTPPAPGYLTATYLGEVFRAELDPELRPAGVVALSHWFNASTGDHLTTTSDPALLGAPPGYAYVGLEGYIYPPSAAPPGAVKLALYRQLWTGDYLTTTARMDWTWRLVQVEGFLPH